LEALDAQVQGTITTVAGGVVPGPAPVDQLPLWTATVKRSGNSLLVLEDGIFGAVRRIDLTTNTATVVAGGGQLDPTEGAIATSVKFTYAFNIAPAPDGDIFVSTNSAVWRVDNVGRMHRVAGTGTAGFSGDGGPAVNAQIYGAQDLIVAPNGDLYLADSVNNRVRKVDSTGTISTVFGPTIPGWSAGSYPTALTTDPSGRVVVGTGYDCPASVWRLNPGANPDLVAGTDHCGPLIEGGPAAGAPVLGAYGLDYGPNGDLYVSDGHTAVRRIDAHGNISVVAGGTNYGDSGDGGPANAAELASPKGLAALPDGRVVVAASRLRMIEVDGTIESYTSYRDGLTSFTGDGGPGASAGLGVPASMAVDGSDNLFIADSSNHRVRRLSAADGTITTIAGTGIAGYSGDGGSGLAATLDTPVGLAIDGAGNVLIADSKNNRVRALDPSGTITTFAGTGAAGSVGNGGAATAAQLDNPVAVAVDS
jgi:hypothetical protein